jgi:hypothetical protein
MKKPLWNSAKTCPTGLQHSLHRATRIREIDDCETDPDDFTAAHPAGSD